MNDAKLTVGIGANTKEFEAAIARSMQKLDQFGHRAKKANEDVGKSGESGAKGLNKVATAAAASTVRLAGLAAVAGPIGRVIAAAVATAGAFAAVLYPVAKAGDEAANSMRKLEALIKVTGHAAGLTGEQIREFSRELAYNTLASTQDVEMAAGKLLTYNKVTGESFKETLRLSQDLAQIGFGSLEENANRLGKALQDPVAGVGALKEVGISFSSSQQAMIKSLVETGKAAEAQGIILKAVAGQVGGAGASQGGLAAGLDALTQRATEFFEVLDERMGASDLFGKVLQKLAESIHAVNEAFREDTPMEAASNTLEEAKERYSRASKALEGYNQEIIRNGGLTGDAVAAGYQRAKQEVELAAAMLASARAHNVKTKSEAEAAQGAVDAAAADEQARIAAEERAAMLAEIRKRSDEVVAGMQKEVALFGEKSELERVQWELQRGAYKDFAPAEKTKIENLAKELDLKKQLLEQEQLSAKMDKLKLPEPFGDEKTRGQQMDEEKAFYDDLFNYHELSWQRREELEKDGNARIEAFKKMSMDQQAGIVTGGLAKMTEALGKHSKEFFKINKIASIANAVINTARGVTASLDLPFPYNLAAAAATAAAGLAQIQTIRSQEFGSGGAAAAPATGGAGAISTTGAPAQEPSRRYISVQGLDTASLFDSRSVRELIRQIQVELGDGVVLTA